MKCRIIVETRSATAIGTLYDQEVQLSNSVEAFAQAHHAMLILQENLPVGTVMSTRIETEVE